MEKLLNFFKLRFIEFSGLMVLALGLIIIYSIATYSPSNPTIIFPDSADTRFILIKYGANFADFILQAFGITAVGLGLNCFAFGGKIIINKQIEYISLRLLFVIFYLIFGSFFLKVYSDQSFWLPDNGNGGFLGAYIVGLFSSIDKQLLKTISYISCVLSLIFFFLSLGVSFQNWKKISTTLFQPFNFLFYKILKRTAQPKTIEEEVENKYDENEIIEDEPYIPATQTNLPLQEDKKAKSFEYRLPSLSFLVLSNVTNKRIVFSFLFCTSFAYASVLVCILVARCSVLVCV